jgi:hypothetical protein
MSITIDRPDTQSARRTRLVAEGVVAGYIHDLSTGATPSVVRERPTPGAGSVALATAGWSRTPHSSPTRSRHFSPPSD